MKHLLCYTSLAIFGLLGGCATMKVLEPTGGSRSDGVVEMSYTTTNSKRVEVDWAAAMEKARERCIAWGYRDAVPFDGWEKICLDPECTTYRVSYPYQCVSEPVTLEKP